MTIYKSNIHFKLKKGLIGTKNCGYFEIQCEPEDSQGSVLDKVQIETFFEEDMYPKEFDNKTHQFRLNEFLTSIIFHNFYDNLSMLMNSHPAATSDSYSGENQVTIKFSLSDKEDVKNKLSIKLFSDLYECE